MLFQQNPNNRPTISDIRNHSWMKDDNDLSDMNSWTYYEFNSVYVARIY